MTDAKSESWSFEGEKAERRTDDVFTCFVEAAADTFGTERLEDFLLTMMERIKLKQITLEPTPPALEIRWKAVNRRGCLANGHFKKHPPLHLFEI